MSRVSGDGVPSFVGVGSNLDDPASQVTRGIATLGAVPEVELLSRSSLYLSAPIGPVDQPDFVNAVVQIETTLSAQELLRVLQKIERLHGRKRGMRWGPRVLDLDLLIYDDEVIDELRLKVPHPGIARRNFVLLPLREIAPEFVIPKLGRVADIAVNEREPLISLIE